MGSFPYGESIFAENWDALGEVEHEPAMHPCGQQIPGLLQEEHFQQVQGGEPSP